VSEAESSEPFWEGGEACVFYVLPDALPDEGFLGRYGGLLNLEERSRYDRFIFAHSKREFLLGRALLKIGLSMLLHLRPEKITFSMSANGKPQLEGVEAKGIEFNLTHTRGLVAVAFTRGLPIGIDAEIVEPLRANSGIAERFFSVPEIEYLSKVEPAKYDRAFFQFWTLKEAYIKARGLGMSLPLKHFDMRLPRVGDQAITIGFAPELEDDPSQWQFHSCEPSDRHVLSVAILRDSVPDVRINVKRLTLPFDFKFEI